MDFNVKLKKALEEARKNISEWQLPEELQVPKTIVKGQILRIGNETETGLVAILDCQDDNYTIAPLSCITENASSRDIVVPVMKSPIKAAFIIEIWNHASVKNLKLYSVYFGKLNDDICTAMSQLYSNIVNKENKNEELYKMWIGLPIDSEFDHRQEFQIEEKKRMRSLLIVFKDILNKIEKQKRTNFMDIVINASKDILSIIKTSGEVLATHEPILVRGKEDKSKKEKIVRVLQKFTSPPILIQASFRKGENIVLVISVFDRNLDDFLHGIEISFDKNKKILSDEKGEVSFVIKAPGNYILQCKTKDKQIAQLNITIN